MEIREIRALLDLMREHDLAELEIEDKKGKVKLVRGTGAHAADGVPAAASQAPQPAANRKGRTSRKAEAPQGAGIDERGAGGIELAPNQTLVASPMVGTFYRAAAPDAPPFVREGDVVRKGQHLCIIEAMKMMNEIEAATSGRVVKILAENSQPVEYGQPLMILEAV